MSHDRRLDFLNKKRIIYKRNPVNDKPTQKYDWGDYYETGTKECYDLFRSKAKINTYKSLKWHLYVLWYLNTNLTQDSFTQLAEFICNRINGFVIFNVSPSLLENIIYEVSMQDLETPPPNKIRKIIFKDNSRLTTSEKLSIVGLIIGRSKKITEPDIYEAMLYIHDLKQKITVKKIAEHFNCATRTIYRNISNELKKEKELLNKEL
jgi:hypothetical protein